MQTAEMIFVGLGANLPGPGCDTAMETCVRAVAALDGLTGLRLVALSRWFETEPVPPSNQPSFINGVAALVGTVTPERLLEALQGIEAAFGRRRSTPNAARPLDLDILAMGSLARAFPDPVLPHPRMHERAFVLAPLLDVAPDWRHPASGLLARDLLAALPFQRAFALASEGRKA